MAWTQDMLPGSNRLIAVLGLGETLMATLVSLLSEPWLSPRKGVPLTYLDSNQEPSH